MKFKLLLSFTFISLFGFSQTTNDPCDSIFIHSCQLNSTGDQVEVLVSNHSADIMSYPGFVLFNTIGDTIAMETVNYFGIGWNEQLHILEIINQPALLFIGTLELHTHFYDSLRCTFPVAMDLSTGISENKTQEVIVYPNPACDWIQLKNIDVEDELFIQIWNVQGRKMKWEWDGNRIYIGHFPSGVYNIEIQNSTSRKYIKLIAP